jgi:hypothetical protein
MRASRWQHHAGPFSAIVIGAMALLNANNAWSKDKEPAPAAESKSATRPAGKTAAQQYKNIQVLKEIPADELMPAMNMMTASLGVRCGFCHVRPFEKDDKKEKATARKMITMTMGLNHGSFGGRNEVSCYTCHRGDAHPVSLPTIPGSTALQLEDLSSNSGVDGGTPAEALPSAEQVVAKYLQAEGGNAVVDKLTSRTAHGTIEGEQMKGDVDESFLAPNKGVSAVHTANGDFTQGFDGTHAWEQGPQGHVRDGEADAARRFADFFRTLDPAKSFSKLKVQHKAKLDNRDVYVLTGEDSHGGKAKLCFDAESGLLVRITELMETPLGSLPSETDFSDYRDVNGVKVPFATRSLEPDEANSTHYSAIQFNVPIEASRFERPADKAPPSKP